MSGSLQQQHNDTWIGSDRFLARTVARPVARFFAIESSSGILLIVATVVALVWANSPWSDAYTSLLETEVGLEVGSFELREEVLYWVNDGLMAIFFFVAGLEIKRELTRGELRDPKAAALPIFGALGGMVVPAIIFFSLNAGTDASHGWGIPMATDIAFAVSVVALLGKRVPNSLKVFLLTLAIADDLGAITVIAVFYTEEVHLSWLAWAGAGIALTWVLQRVKVWYLPVYLVVGAFVWFATLESGVHATLAGVAMGLLTPTRPLREDLDPNAIADALEGRDLEPADVRSASFMINEAVPVADRLIDLLHPWTSYVIIPLFALVNAGVVVSSDSLSAAFGSTITLGVLLGLVVGKTVGVSLAAMAAAKLGIAVLPRGIRFRDLVAVGMAAGIGFTVALFVTVLAFDDPGRQEEAKIGILAGSFIAAVGCSILFSLFARSRGETGDDEPSDPLAELDGIEAVEEGVR
jgi:NhaA family Na+:H+ antiporter